MENFICQLVGVEEFCGLDLMDGEFCVFCVEICSIIKIFDWVNKWLGFF